MSLVERIINKLYRAVAPENEFFTKSFSQNGEDAILSYLFLNKFKKKNPGFYIDIGAYHPFKFSNTFKLHNRGWQGINVDVSEESIQLFNKFRPNDININAAISTTSGKINFYELKGKKSMTTTEKRHLLEFGASEDAILCKEVQAISLENLLDQKLGKDQVIDYLDIDVEGADFEVLQSNNWEKYRPLVISIELDTFTLQEIDNHTITSFLQDKGYHPIAKTFLFKNVSSVIFINSDFETQIGFASPV